MTLANKSHNSTQELYSNDTSEGVSHSFQTENDLMTTIKRQKTLGRAMSIINDINHLNGYKVVTDYQIIQIKNYYKQKEEYIKKKYKQLQKGYMELLTNQITY